MESGLHFSLHENCHHQIIYAKFIIHLLIKAKSRFIKKQACKT